MQGLVMSSDKNESSLANLQVLDMAQGGCAICGKVFADLGADVIKIEPPGGDPSRCIGPFYKDIPDPQKSLSWFAYNTSKRSITLNIETSDGQQIFRKLAKTTDIVVESFPPGYLDNLGIGYQVLSQLNPGIIVTSITPYGQTGPKAHYKGCDLTAWASSDGLFTTGDPDRPPVWISFPQPSLHAGVEACVGSLIAYWHRVNSSEGQHVDVSVQDTFFWSMDQARLQMYEMMGFCYTRTGSRGHLATGVKRDQHYVCKDGFIAFLAAGGGLRKQRESTENTVKWMAEEGMASDWLVNYDWEKDYDTSRLTQEESDRIDQEFREFFMTKTKAELFEQALKRDIVLAPVYTAEDICELKHLKARDYWVEVEHDELNDKLIYCGFLKNTFSETPGRIKQRAPLIGEHNLEIYERELNFSREELGILKNSGVI
jgi:benzylsuccinate CoA-transferase BbsE subunit